MPINVRWERCYGIWIIWIETLYRNDFREQQYLVEFDQ